MWSCVIQTTNVAQERKAQGKNNVLVPIHHLRDQTYSFDIHFFSFFSCRSLSFAFAFNGTSNTKNEMYSIWQNTYNIIVAGSRESLLPHYYRVFSTIIGWDYVLADQLILNGTADRIFMICTLNARGSDWHKPVYFGDTRQFQRNTMSTELDWMQRVVNDLDYAIELCFKCVTGPPLYRLKQKANVTIMRAKFSASSFSCVEVWFA